MRVARLVVLVVAALASSSCATMTVDQCKASCHTQNMKMGGFVGSRCQFVLRTAPISCKAKGSLCMEVGSCNGKVETGLCNGPSYLQCRFPR